MKAKTKKPKINKQLSKIPTLVPSKKQNEGNYPVEHLSPSSMNLFGSNPVMFKIRYINKEYPDSTLSSTLLLGKAFHYACEVYHGGSDEYIISDEAEAIKYGLSAGLKYIDEFHEGNIDWKSTVKDKNTALEKFSFMFNEYVLFNEKYHSTWKVVALEETIKAQPDFEFKGNVIKLPIPIKVIVDQVYRKEVNGVERLCIYDYKTTASFSSEDKIDGAKIIQAVTNFIGVYAKYGEAPYSMTFGEIKHTKNQGKDEFGNPLEQIREYEFIFEENDLFFDLFFRYYGDIVRALSGHEQVYVPNLNAMFDSELALISYIHMLDVPEELAKQLKEAKVKTMTDLLEKKVATAMNMKSFAKILKQLQEVKPIDYSNMKPQDQIVTKYAQFGKLIYFHSIIESNTVDTYLFTPGTGTRMSAVKSHEDDIQQIIGKSNIRVLAPVPNTNFIGIEVPREERKFLNLTEKKVEDYVLDIGIDSMNNEYKYDILSAPHMLIAGTTGSGKSYFLRSIIKQLLNKDDCELHLFDPKKVELSMHEDEKNVVEYVDEIVPMHQALNELTNIMDSRFSLFKENKVRDIKEYNALGKKMKYKFVIIEEFGDLMQTKEKRTETYVESYNTKGEPKIKVKHYPLAPEIESSVLRLAQKARAAGIHLIIATQRPSTDVITGTIKANFPVKIGLRVSNVHDSGVILGESGAEKLLGKGDMLFQDETGITRLQAYSA